MTDGLSRRNLMLLAGAGVALAACKDNGLVRYGRWPTHGKVPKKPEYEQGGSAPKFEPNYITLVHIDSMGPWSMSVNHAVYHLPGADGPARLRRAEELFKLRRPKTGPKPKFGQLTGPHQPHAKHGKLDFDDFDRFGFGSQHEIFFFFDSPDVVVDESWLISFAPASDTNKPMAENYSFFNSTSIPVSFYDGNKTGTIVRVENLFTEDNGKVIDVQDGSKTKIYSMNLHFKIGKVPMILDPETGNGAGHEP